MRTIDHTPVRPNLHCERQAAVQNGNFKQMHPLCFFRYRLEIWHGYTMDCPLNSPIMCQAYVFWMQCQSCLNIGDMHVFHFKMYISAVFWYIAQNLSPYSPTVTCYVCAKFEAFPTFRTRGVNVCVFGQVVVTALYTHGLTI